MVRPYFFHHRLGYRSNPFGALTRAEWTAVAFIPPAVQTILDEGFSHLQLLGAKGCGKTTTLLKLAAHFENEGKRVVYEYLADGQNHFESDLAGVDLFVLDEAQRLNRRERRRWLAAGSKYIFSSHEDLSPLFKQAIKTVGVDTAVSLPHYHTWIQRRLAYFALLDVPCVVLSGAAVAYLYHTFGPDMREAEYFLYEVFQQDWAPGEIGIGEISELYKEWRLRD
jgi:hypothetical protein